jgi:protocatechuate 3,4-dioxygenase beta subunit
MPTEPIPPGRQRVITRRGLLRLGLSMPPMFLLAACGGPPVAAPTAAATTKPASATTAPVATAAPAVVPVASPATTAAPPAQAGGAQGATPSCVVRPQQTQGPYWVDEMLNRSDIRSDPSDGTVKEGVPVRLVFRVSQVAGGSCTPIVGAQVDIWQCDALGVYSDAQDPGFNTSGKKFLRGYQLTDARGEAQFVTIYPGWYQGRAVHIHVKVHIGGSVVHTGQLFFPDALTATVYESEPYSGRGAPDTTDASDSIFRNGGSKGMLSLTKQPSGGYVGAILMGVHTA